MASATATHCTGIRINVPVTAWHENAHFDPEFVNANPITLGCTNYKCKDNGCVNSNTVIELTFPIDTTKKYYRVLRPNDKKYRPLSNHPVLCDKDLPLRDSIVEDHYPDGKSDGGPGLDFDLGQYNGFYCVWEEDLLNYIFGWGTNVSQVLIPRDAKSRLVKEFGDIVYACDKFYLLPSVPITPKFIAGIFKKKDDNGRLTVKCITNFMELNNMYFGKRVPGHHPNYRLPPAPLSKGCITTPSEEEYNDMVTVKVNMKSEDGQILFKYSDMVEVIQITEHYLMKCYNNNVDA